VIKRIYIGAMIVALLIGIVWYETAYHSETKKIASLQSKEQTATQAYVTLQHHYVALVASEKFVPAERVALAHLRQLLPDGPELDNIETTLFGLVAKSGAQIQQIQSPEPAGFGTPAATPAAPSGAKPAAATPTGPGQVSLTLGVQGTAAQIKRLYGLLNAAPRLFVVDTFVVPVAPPSGPGATSSGGGTVAASAGNTTAPGTVAVTIALRAFYAVANAQSAASN
jgi:hypothetical protein